MSNAKIKAKILMVIQNFFKDEDDLIEKINEGIYDYLDDDWQDDAEDEEEWYMEYGRGEVESEYHDKIIKEIQKSLKFENDDFYFKNTYGDIDSMIFQIWPRLNVK